MKNNKLLPLSDHIHELRCAASYFFGEAELGVSLSMGNVHFEACLDWLSLASDISGVDMTPRYSNSAMWCSDAYEYERQTKDFRNKMAFRISRLLFIWSAFESFSLDFDYAPSSSLKRSGPGVHCKEFLDKHVSSVDCSVKEIWALISKIHSEHEDYKKKDEAFYLWSSGSLINIARDIRNKVAHGASALKESDDYSFGIGLSTECQLYFIDLASRSILLTMQMLLKYDLVDSCMEYWVEDLNHTVDIKDYMATLHLNGVKRLDFIYY